MRQNKEQNCPHSGEVGLDGWIKKAQDFHPRDSTLLLFQLFIFSFRLNV